MKRSHTCRWLFAIAFTIFTPYGTAGEVNCGSLKNAYGPYDYTNADHRANKIPIVVDAHFTENVRNLVKGESGTIIGELDYTLRAIPNHHLALDSMSRYFLLGGNRERFLTPECYFDRAIRFKPNDATVRLLYGIYLHKRKRIDPAEEQYLLAIDLREDYAEAHYDLALLYTELGKWDAAKPHAVAAYRLGHPFQALKNRLKSRGLWSESDEQSTGKGAATEGG